MEGLNTLSTDDVDGPANIDAANVGDRMLPQFEPDIEHIIREFEQKLHVQVGLCMLGVIDGHECEHLHAFRANCTQNMPCF